MNKTEETELRKVTEKLAIAIDRLLKCIYADGYPRTCDEDYANKWWARAKTLLGKPCLWQ